MDELFGKGTEGAGWVIGLLIGVVSTLLLVISWFSRKTLKDVYREIERLETEVKNTQHDVSLLQERLFELDKKGIQDSTYLETFKDTVHRLEEEMGSINRSFNKWHERLSELKDMINEKLHKKSRD